MIFNKFSSIIGFSLMLYTVITLIALYLLCCTGTVGIVVGIINTICNAVVIWFAYETFRSK